MSQMPSALATVSAVHVLMARHIELSDLPVAWRVASDGTLYMEPNDRTPEGRDAVRALAAVLGVDTDESEITSRVDGQRLSVVSLPYKATIAGARVYSTAYLPLDAPAAEDGGE